MVVILGPMRSLSIVTWLFAIAPSTGAVLLRRASERVTPVEKVTQLLNQLLAKVEDQGKLEATQYDKYACFCKEQADDKLYSIEKYTKEIELLTAQIGALDSEIAEKLLVLQGKTTDKENTKSTIATMIANRAIEHETFSKNLDDINAAIDAVGRALAWLKQQKKGVADHISLSAVPGLAQVRARASKLASVGSLSQRLQLALSSFERQDPVKYQFHSDAVIRTLEELQTSFKEHAQSLVTDEDSKQNDHDVQVVALESHIRVLTDAIADLNKRLGEATAAKEEAEKLKAEKTADMKAQQNFLGELKAMCETKATNWDQRSKTRAGEITAISEAIRIVEAGVKPNYHVNTKLNLAQSGRGIQPGAPTRASSSNSLSFLQRAQRTDNTVPARRAVELLSTAASRLQSSALASLVLNARIDHFVKVRELIKDLITNLEGQKAADEDFASFCETQLADAHTRMESTQTSLEGKDAALASTKASIDQLNQDIENYSNEIEALSHALAEATALRGSEKSTFEKSLADAQEGKAAAEEALKILKDFYESAGLLQTGYVPPNADRDGKTVGDLAPESWEGTYSGSQSESHGVIGLMEVILADFERTVTSLQNIEGMSDQEFVEFQTKSQADIATNEENKDTASSDLTEQESSLDTLTKERETLEKTKTAIKAELDNLNGMCVDTGMDVQRRRDARLKEVDALKEALVVLDNWSG